MGRKPYIGRFAPSPTGPLHYGSLVAAVASYLDARHSNGQWLVRIEDLDPPRESAEAPAIIIAQLTAFGLVPDGTVLYQSTRLDAYQAALDRLSASGSTFACTCTRRQTPAVYPGTCRGKQPEDMDKPFAIRLQVPDVRVAIDDPVAGRRSWQLNEVGDFIIRRKDGLFAYQLAVVVDDVFQCISHVVRGADLLESTPWQLAVYAILDEPPPRYMHLPVLVDKSGEKLSKQAHAPAVDLDSPLNTLRQVLLDLGQRPQPRSNSVSEILTSATLDWDTGLIPKTSKIPAPKTATEN